MGWDINIQYFWGNFELCWDLVSFPARVVRVCHESRTRCKPILQWGPVLHPVQTVSRVFCIETGLLFHQQNAKVLWYRAITIVVLYIFFGHFLYHIFHLANTESSRSFRGLKYSRKSNQVIGVHKQYLCSILDYLRLNKMSF